MGENFGIKERKEYNFWRITPPPRGAVLSFQLNIRMKTMRDLIALFENEIERTADRAIVNLRSHDSMVYTKLAQKVQKIDALEKEIKALKEEVKAEAKQHVADLFAAEDEVRTRVVNTLSFILTLSKTPNPTVTVQYSKVIAELEQQLTPELVVVLTDLKEKFSTVSQREPSLKVVPVTEGIGSYFAKLLDFIRKWGKNYDNKLNQLKKMI